MVDITVDIIETNIEGVVVDGDTIEATVSESVITATLSPLSEVDPVFVAHDAFDIVTGDITLLGDLSSLALTDGNFIVGDGTNWVVESGGTVRASIGLTIGTHVQAWDAQLDDIAALAVTDGNFIVGDGTNWVAESGNTARTSLGLGTGDSPTFAGLTVNGALVIQSATPWLYIHHNSPTISDEIGIDFGATGIHKIARITAVGTINYGGNLYFETSVNDGAYQKRLTILQGGNVGIGIATPLSLLHLGTATEELEIVDAGSADATEQDWIEVEVGGNQGYIRVFAAK